MQRIKILIAEWWPDWQPLLKRETERALGIIGIETNDILTTGEFLVAYKWLDDMGPWSLLISDVTLSQQQRQEQMLGRILLERAKELQVPSIAISGWPKLTPKHVRDILLIDGASDFFYKRDWFPPSEFRKLIQRLILLAAFPLHQRKLIADTIKQFDPEQLRKIFEALQRIEAMNNEDIEQKLTEVDDIFTELLQGKLLEEKIPLKTDVETISTVLATTKLDALQKLKLTIPIIPWILIYEAQLELPNLNIRERLQNIWRRLLD